MRGFLDGQPREETEFDDAGLFRIDSRESLERDIDGKHVFGPGRLVRLLYYSVEPDARSPIATLLSVACARVIHENATHQSSSQTKEVRPILPGHSLLIDQPEVDLVDEGRRNKRVICAFSPQLAAGDPPQFPVDVRQQLLERGGISLGPSYEQLRHVCCQRRCVRLLQTHVH